MGIRVVIADDHPLSREGIRTFLENEGMDVVGTASNGVELLSLIASCTPDVALVDACMPVMDGIEAAKRIRERYPHVPILMLSAFDDPGRVTAALAAGAGGYILKDRDAAQLGRALRAVAAGHSALDKRLVGTAAL